MSETYANTRLRKLTSNPAPPNMDESQRSMKLESLEHLTEFEFAITVEAGDEPTHTVVSWLSAFPRRSVASNSAGPAMRCMSPLWRQRSSAFARHRCEDRES